MRTRHGQILCDIIGHIITDIREGHVDCRINSVFNCVRNIKGRLSHSRLTLIFLQFQMYWSIIKTNLVCAAWDKVHIINLKEDVGLRIHGDSETTCTHDLIFSSILSVVRHRCYSYIKCFRSIGSTIKTCYRNRTLDGSSGQSIG